VGVCLWLWVELRQEALSVQERSAVPVPDIQALSSARAAGKERDTLKEELRRLKEELAAAAIKGQAHGGAGEVSIPRDEERVLHLRAENSAFRAQLDEAAAQAGQKAEELASARAELGRLKEALASSGAAQQLVSQAKEEYQQRLDELDAEIKQLRVENARLGVFSAAGEELESLRQEKEELSARIRELEMTGAIQAQKNEHLQYELTKSRAQVIGLERMCENAAKPRMGTGGPGPSGV
jgi:chromosome segregation ATPase